MFYSDIYYNISQFLGTIESFKTLYYLEKESYNAIEYIREDVCIKSMSKYNRTSEDRFSYACKIGFMDYIKHWLNNKPYEDIHKHIIKGIGYAALKHNTVLMLYLILKIDRRLTIKEECANMDILEKVVNVDDADCYYFLGNVLHSALHESYGNLAQFVCKYDAVNIFDTYYHRFGDLKTFVIKLIKHKCVKILTHILQNKNVVLDLIAQYSTH